MSTLTKAVKPISIYELESHKPTFPVVTTDTYSFHKHFDVLDESMGILRSKGFSVKETKLLISEDGTRFFGTLKLSHKKVKSDKRGYSILAGVRNSYDKSTSIGFVIGAHVMVCSNMSFYGDLSASHKHSKYGGANIGDRINKSVAMILERDKIQEEMFAKMAKHELSIEQYQNILIESVKRNIIDSVDLKRITNEVDHPSYDYDASKKSAWNIYNAFTLAMGRGFRYKPQATISKSIKITEVFNQIVGSN